MQSHDTWKTLLSNGNQAFEQQQWSRALLLYENAIQFAYQHYRLTQEALSEDNITGVLVCYFNIADTHLRLNQFQAANAQFTHCFRFLEGIISHHPKQPILLRIYSHSHTEWLRFQHHLKQQGVHLPDPPELQRIAHHFSSPTSLH